MATRTEISLDDELHARALKRAKTLGVTLEECLAELISQGLPERPTERKAHVSEIFGLGDSGGTNIAKDKHRLIAEAIAADKVK